MSSFINKFFGFVKDVLTGKKKEITHEPEIIPESQSQIETEPESKIESSLQELTQEHERPEQEVIHESEPEAEFESSLHEVIPEAQPELEPEHEYKPESEPDLQPEAESVSHSMPEPEAEPEPEPELESEQQPEPEPESQPEPVPESKPEPHTEPETETSEHEYDYTQLEQRIRNIITQHYNYSGFMIHDTAGYSRFRTYARDYELELPVSDSELRKLIIHSGTLIDGIVYVFTHDDVNRMLCEVQRMLDEGVSVIYFRDLESFIEDSNLYHNLTNRRAIREILSDNYDKYIFTDLYMERPERKKFRSYMEGLKYILAKYFPEGFNSDYALLRKYADKENIILSGNDKALKREIEALK